MGQPIYESLDEFFTELDNFHGGWPKYQQKFETYSADARIIELKAFDRLFENEHRPSRELGEYLARRRWMGDVHELCLRAGR
jgi:hypothetical protein